VPVQCSDDFMVSQDIHCKSGPTVPDHGIINFLVGIPLMQTKQ